MADAGVPTGTVTFLFTDIEGSTRRWAEHGAAMAKSLDHHDEIVRQAIDHHDGYVFTTAGDSFAAAFADASLAVAAAATIQRDLAAFDFDEVGGLPVRIGLHSGNAVERDGDYFGPEVNLAARVMGTAHGGQVVLTDVVASLANASTRDLGQHELRDIAAPLRLSQLLGDGLEAEFPPLRTTSTNRVSLPAQRSRFIGRATEMRAVRKLIEDSSLITLTGTGGTGKTRLAIEVAAELASHLDGDVVFVDLSAATDADDVDAQLSRALDVAPDGTHSVRGQLLRHIGSEVALLVLDNCEHLLDDVIDLVDVLGAAPETTLLVTSRELLDVDGERVYRVPSLSTTAADAPAIRLFLDRALSADPDLTPDDDDRQVISEICARLDGIPLAIELAAARARALGFADIRDGLDDRFALLTGGRRRGRQRQQTLESTISWSYDLLDERERQAFCGLGVFTSSFDLAAARAVIACSTGEAIDLLDSLVARSLVIHEAGSRYRMFETLRAFAETRLSDEGHDATAAVRDRHLDHYLALAPRNDMMATATRAESDAVSEDLDNVLLALDWAITRRQAGEAARLASALSTYVDRGLTELIRSRLTDTLEIDHTPDDKVSLLCAMALVVVLERSSDIDITLPRLVEAAEHPSVTAELRAVAHRLDDFLTAAIQTRYSTDHPGLMPARITKLDPSPRGVPAAACDMYEAMTRCYDFDWEAVLQASRRSFANSPSMSTSTGAADCEIFALLALGRPNEALAATERCPFPRPGLWSVVRTNAHIHALTAAGRVEEASTRLIECASREVTLSISGVRGMLLMSCAGVFDAIDEPVLAEHLYGRSAAITRTPAPAFYAIALLQSRNPDLLEPPVAAGLRSADQLSTAYVEAELERTSELEQHLEHIRDLFA